MFGDGNDTPTTVHITDFNTFFSDSVLNLFTFTIELSESFDAKEIETRLNAQLPAGLGLTEVVSLESFMTPSKAMRARIQVCSKEQTG